jgi:sugar lactone lactonase YvrE
MVRLSQVRKIRPSGGESVYYQFPEGTGIAGLAVDPVGNVYAGVVAVGNPDLHGVWKIYRRGNAVHLPGSEAMGLPPNGLAFDPAGNLWVTDSWVLDSDPPLGSVWRIPPGGEAELWYQDSAYLGGLGALPGYPPIGANGIVYYNRRLYVANSERGHVVRIPVLPNGQPGQPEVVFADPALWLIDGLTLNPRGTIFAAIIGQDRIVGLCPATGKWGVVAEGDPLDGPASLIFGNGYEQFRTIYFTNYAVLSADPAPGILKLDIPFPPLVEP